MFVLSIYAYLQNLQALIITFCNLFHSVLNLSLAIPASLVYTGFMKYRDKIKDIPLCKLAKALGKSESTASRIRSNERKPDLDEAQALINGFKSKLVPRDFFQ